MSDTTITKSGYPHPCGPPGGGSWGCCSNRASNDGLLSIEQFMAALKADGGDTDLVFALFAKQIMDADQQIKDRLVKFDHVANCRKQVNKHLDMLRKVRQFLAKYGGGDEEMSLREMNKQINGKDEHPCPEDLEKIKQHLGFDFGSYEFKFDPRSGEVTKSRGAEDLGRNQLGCPNFRLNTQHLDEEIKRQEAWLGELSQMNQIEMTRLNSIINKKAQATQLLSNIMKKRNDTALALINNVR